MEPSTWIKDTGSPSAGHPFSSLNPNASEFIPRFNSAPTTPQQPPILHQNIPLIRPCLPPGYALVPAIPQASNAPRPSFGYQPFTITTQMTHVIDTSYEVSEHCCEDKKELEKPLLHQKVEDKAKIENFQHKTNFGFNQGVSRGYKHSPETYRPRTDPENLIGNFNQKSWDKHGEERQQEKLRNHDRNFRERGNRWNDIYQNDAGSSAEAKTDEKRTENIEEAHRTYEPNFKGGFNNRGSRGHRRELLRHQNDFCDKKFERGNDDWRDINEGKPHEPYRTYNSNYKGGFNRGRGLGRGGQRWNRSREETLRHQSDKRIELGKDEITLENTPNSRSWIEDGQEKDYKPLKTYDNNYRGKGRGGKRSNISEKQSPHDDNEKGNLEENDGSVWEGAIETNQDKIIESESHHHNGQNNIKAKDHCNKEEWDSSWEDNSKDMLLKKQNTTHCQRHIDDTSQNISDFEENKSGPVHEKSENARTSIKEEDQTEKDHAQKSSVEKSDNQANSAKSSPKARGGRRNGKSTGPRFDRQNQETERNSSEQDTKNFSRKGRFSNNRDSSKNQDFKLRGKGFGNRGKFSDRKSFTSNETKWNSSEEHIIASESNNTSETAPEKEEINRSWIQEVMEEDEKNCQEQIQEAPQPLSWRTRDNGGASATNRCWDKERKSRRSWEGQNGDIGSWRDRSKTLPELCKLRDPRMEREKRSANSKLTKFEQWEKQWMAMPQGKIIEEIEGDLFDQPKEFSLTHCVAEDFRMGSGIAVTFKQEFGNLAELLDQGITQGGLATLFNDEYQRFIYYLVTKKGSTGKPVYQDLWQSLCKLRDHIKENKVRKLAMPRLGCGLDRLEWNKVKAMIAHLFDNVDVKIRVCHLVENDPIEEKKSITCKLAVEDNTVITNIDPGTLLLYFSDTEDTCDDTMLRLSKKFNFMEEFRQQKPKSLGDIVYFDDSITNFGVCGCIVREAPTEPISFKALNKCMENINEKNKTFGDSAFAYVAMQWVNEEAYLDEMVNQKIITVLINVLQDMNVHVCKGSFGDEGE